MEYLDLILDIGNSKLDYINKYGFAKAGCNGPYVNRDTPIRNSGHWLITYAYLYEQTGERKYIDAVERLASFLIDKSNYGANGCIRHRLDYRFDNTNGIIGQAWTIESLIAAAQCLKDQKYYHKAVEIFKSQKFNYKHNFWEITDYNGDRDFDKTFNHQLWFAASGSQILKYESDNNFEISKNIDEQIVLFLTEADRRYFTVYEDGLIVHVMNCDFSKEEKRYKADLENRRKKSSFMHNPLSVLKKKISDKMAKYPFTDGLERGYHIFDLYGFALLYDRYKECSIYKSKKFKDAVHYALDTNAMIDLMQPCGGYPFNKFAFAYNSPAFEYPYVNLVFGSDKETNTARNLFDFQVEMTYDASKHSLSNNCRDSETMDARIYELIPFLKS